MARKITVRSSGAYTLPGPDVRQATVGIDAWPACDRRKRARRRPDIRLFGDLDRRLCPGRRLKDWISRGVRPEPPET